MKARFDAHKRDIYGGPNETRTRLNSSAKFKTGWSQGDNVNQVKKLRDDLQNYVNNGSGENGVSNWEC